MELNRISTVCFTGHRSIPPEWEREIRDAAENALRTLVMRGYDTFLLGGALGFDTLAQLTAMHLREEFPFLRIVMAIPCLNQDAQWQEKDRRIYRLLLRTADERIVLRENYTAGCMLERNRFMVEHSSACVACFDGRQRGGTAYTVRCARQQGLTVINVWNVLSRQIGLPE